MAARESSRSLGSWLGGSRLSDPTLSDVAGNSGKRASEAVHAGADDGARSAFESPVLEGATKRQCTDEPSTGEHQAAPAGDHAAPRETPSNGAVPPCQPHPCTGKLH